MPSDPGHVPPGKVTAFDRAQYDNLISWIDSVDRDLNTRLNKPRPGVRLDETLGSGIHPGSSRWTPAVNLVAKAKVFGKSAADRYAELSKDWEQFVLALRNARDVFESTNDLGKYGATKFLNDYPDVLPTTNGGPSPKP
jgi:hypothetical protein